MKVTTADKRNQEEQERKDKNDNEKDGEKPETMNELERLMVHGDETIVGHSGVRRKHY